ncbi:hypothetical protein DFJ58DRAFT_866746 [Suillus subalutaceus]|uniref:uncharacterized protein n=1 Tax=Suillus subalutaceus TaxID=48586 RepID=UPI001B881FBB|nr:uncharacterized protein DFJ58DRAFT_866746 [Suillus subalutaceus]KAG1864626.1 hypothetical protein DFJ58DRAFT_866746 [Suillus subalutaceus]
MLRRPPAIAPEVWDSWPDSLKKTIAETPEVYMAPANSDIDPALLNSSNGPSASRCTPHDADRDGPHQPMLSANPSAANNSTRGHNIRNSTPANVEELADILYNMREDQREHYKQTDDRLAHLEGSHPDHQTSSTTRGCTTQHWGGSNIARRRRRRDACEEGNDAESHTGQFDHDAEDVTDARGKLSATAREVRADLKRLILTKFRHVCNVSEGKTWPSPDDERKNETTGEIYLTPNFEATVNDDHNRVIFKKIAHLVWEELGSTTLSNSMSNRKVKWNKQSLFTFAKDTYRGFKEEWKAQNDRKKAAAKNTNQQKNRWSQRHKEVGR